MAEPAKILPFARSKTESEQVRMVLRNGGGGDNYGGMDAWQTSVENRLGSLDSRLGRLDDKVDRNFVVTWGGMIVGFVGLAGLMAKGFGWF